MTICRAIWKSYITKPPQVLIHPIQKLDTSLQPTHFQNIPWVEERVFPSNISQTSSTRTHSFIILLLSTSESPKNFKTRHRKNVCFRKPHMLRISCSPIYKTQNYWKHQSITVIVFHLHHIMHNITVEHSTRVQWHLKPLKFNVQRLQETFSQSTRTSHFSHKRDSL